MSQTASGRVLKSTENKPKVKEVTKPFKCNICKSQFAQTQTKLRHLQSHHVDVTFSKHGKKRRAAAAKKETKSNSCLMCDEDCSTNSRPWNHMATIPLKNKCYKCEYCKATFTDLQKFRGHVNNECPGSSFRCKLCSKLMKTQFNLTRHITEVHKKDRRFKCDYCNEGFFRSDRWKIHVRSHESHRSFECEVCNKQFIRKHELVSHMTSAHTEPKQESHKCLFCDKLFVTRRACKAHLLSHSTANPYECEICFKHFPMKSTLATHVEKVHFKLKPHKCDRCDKSYYSTLEADRHALTHHGEHPFVCHVCSKGFQTSWGMLKHVKISHSNQNPYKCQSCDLTFADRGSWRTHMLSKRHWNDNSNKSKTLNHILSKPFVMYACEECGRKFKSQESLQKHWLTHLDMNEFVCETCDKRFFTLVELRRHSKEAHQETTGPMTSARAKLFSSPNGPVASSEGHQTAVKETIV